MSTITTYSARRSNIFVWLTVLLCTVSAVTRIVYYCQVGVANTWVTLVHLLLPVAANICIAIRLPQRGEEMFYVTIVPVNMYTAYFFCHIIGWGYTGWMAAACIALCFIVFLLYNLTFSGHVPTKLPILFIVIFVPVALYFVDPRFMKMMQLYLMYIPMLFISDMGILASVWCCVLSARKLPPPKEGEPYRRRWGDRVDGILVRNLAPQWKLSPYFMVTRNGSSNFIYDSIDTSAMDKYVHRKRKEGLSHFGITHVFIAAYVRACSQLPGLNRFLSGQRIYSKKDIVVSMVIKKDMEKDAPDTTIKVTFDPADTAGQIYEKFDKKVQEVKESSDLNSSYDKVTKLIDGIPGFLISILIWSFKVFDYLGILSQSLIKLSPFHASMFITSMGSLGIPPIFHHLYDFGTVPLFCSFGCKKTVRELDDDGNVIKKKYIDYTWVTDERIVDGFYYAKALKLIRSYLLHPERLDEPPEQVIPDAI